MYPNSDKARHCVHVLFSSAERLGRCGSGLPRAGTRRPRPNEGNAWATTGSRCLQSRRPLQQTHSLGTALASSGSPLSALFALFALLSVRSSSWGSFFGGSCEHPARTEHALTAPLSAFLRRQRVWSFWSFCRPCVLPPRKSFRLQASHAQRATDNEHACGGPTQVASGPTVDLTLRCCEYPCVGEGPLSW